MLTLDGLNAKLTDDKKLTAPEGYEFGGWLLLNTANGIIGEANENDQLPVYSVWKIRANWVKKSVEYTLTLDMNGGDPLQGHTAYEGGYFELPTIEVINHPDGLEFDYFDIGDGNKYEAHEFIPATGNVTAVAHWKNAYTITFAANGGTGEMASVTVNAGDSYTFPECGFTAPEGKVFDSWYYSYEGLDDYEPGFTVVDIHSSFTLKAIWKDAPVETQKVTITFEANGGEGEMASVTVDMGATIVLPECSFTKTGHTFAGWTYEETLQPGASLTVNTDMSILAVWDRNPCVLTFKPGEGTGEVKTYDMLYGDGVELRDPSVHGFSYEGHECVGWTDGTNTYTLGTLLDVEKDVTYTALWKKLSYTITFEGEQGSMDGVTKEYGDTYVLPECGFQAPINNEFKAWDVNGTEYQIGASITVTGNVTVKPVWQWIEYTVTFDAQGGTGTMEPVTVLAGTDFTVPMCTFGAPEFKLFSAWVVDDEIVGGRYKAGDVITVYNDITLNAGWMNSEYKITYKSGAADDAEIYEDPIVGGSAYTLMNNMFTAPEGKMFRCWLFPVPPTFTETEELDPGTPFSRVGSNLTFIADWEPLKYIISFDGNGGSGSMEAVVVEHGGEFTIPESGFTAPTGMVFSGWKLDGEAKKPGDSLIVTGGVTLSAQWAPMELAVSFDPGDRGGDSKTQTQLYGVKFNLPYLSDLGWDDYLSGSVFLGWNLNGEYLAEGAAFTATADTTLTAMWADRYYTITIKDSNESAAPTSVTVEYGDSYTLKSASAYGFSPKDSRIHVFDNWMRTSDQKTFAPGDTIRGITRSMAFEAKWTFGTIVEVEDEETGEVVETVVEVEVKTQPEEINQNDASVMNTSDPSKLPEQLGNMLATLQVNTAGAEAEGGVVIETMQDVVDALHESINGTVTTETEELEYPAENIAVTDIIPILEIEIDGVVEKIEITDKSLMPDDTGIEVALEIPAGTDPATHQYKITHMLTQDAWDGSNKKAGDIETLTVHRYDEKYLYVMMKNFSPVAIAWKELPAEVIIPDVVIEELPQTGDPSSLLAWVTLLGASGIGLHAMKRRKK
ncbi:MAG: InlB B-repeat-containing protein [Clostridia bacterium]|nr:InlB B-repeat-containing protein [Clostridia bacterium]